MAEGVSEAADSEGKEGPGRKGGLLRRSCERIDACQQGGSVSGSPCLALPPVLSPTTAGFLPPSGSVARREAPQPLPAPEGGEAEMGLMEGRPQVWEEEDAPPSWLGGGFWGGGQSFKTWGLKVAEMDLPFGGGSSGLPKLWRSLAGAEGVAALYKIKGGGGVLVGPCLDGPGSPCPLFPDHG